MKIFVSEHRALDWVNSPTKQRSRIGPGDGNILPKNQMSMCLKTQTMCRIVYDALVPYNFKVTE